MWKRIAAAAAVAACVIAIAAAQLGRPAISSSASAELLAPVTRKSFDIRITESGVLEALHSVTLSCTIPSNNARIIYIVPEGSQVDKGDVLVRFDPSPFEADVQKYTSQLAAQTAAAKEAEESLELEKLAAQRERGAAAHEIRLAELRLENVLKGEGIVSLEEANSKMVQSQALLERARGHARDLEALHEEGFVNDDELKNARSAEAEAEAASRLSKLRFETQRDYTYPAEQEKARAELAKARTEADQLELALKHRMARSLALKQSADHLLDLCRENMRVAKELLARTVIAAPGPGFVVYRETSYVGAESHKPRVGDSVYTNQPLILLPDVTTMIVESKIREVDIHKIKVGQDVQVTVGAYPEPVHTGKVDFIGTLAATDPRTKSAAKYFSLRVLLDGTDERLRPGMTARIDILVGRVEDKLTVPVSAVFREGASTVCYRVEGRRAVRCEVQTGASDEQTVVIESGLSENDRVLLRKPEGGGD